MLNIRIIVDLDGKVLADECGEVNEVLLSYKYQRAFQLEQEIKRIAERASSETIEKYDKKIEKN